MTSVGRKAFTSHRTWNARQIKILVGAAAVGSAAGWAEGWTTGVQVGLAVAGGLHLLLPPRRRRGGRTRQRSFR